MKFHRIFPALVSISLVLGCGIAAAGHAPPMQEATANASRVALTAEERSSVESILLGDKRIRQLVGQEKPRILISAPEADKAEVEAFLEGASEKAPSHRLVATLFNPKTNKAARAVVLLEGQRILEVEEVKASEVPLSVEDAEDALALAKASPEVEKALGEKVERFSLAEPGKETRSGFVAEALPLRSTNPRDPCSTNRCLDLIFRTEQGYLPVRAHVDLTKRTVTAQVRKHHEENGHEGGKHQ